MTSATEALERLRQGNQRFLNRTVSLDALAALGSPGKLVDGQSPFAVILGCADSRVPVELLFDQSLGDLFVVRVAGNFAGPSQMGSIEYAIAHLGTPLIVVLGHSHCGAVAATLQGVQGGGDPGTDGLRAIIDELRPAVERVLAERDGGDAAELAQEAMQANVRATVDRLCRESPVLSEAIAGGRLSVIGAEYDLATGAVEFYEELST